MSADGRSGPQGVRSGPRVLPGPNHPNRVRSGRLSGPQEARQLVHRAETEEELRVKVERLAQLRHWLVYHTHDSRRSYPGFPDEILLRAGRQVVAELKSMAGRLTREQNVWLAEFARAGAEVYVWRPDDWDWIEEVLR